MAPKRRSLIQAALIDYLDQSQVHGYKIIVSPDRPYVERLLWTGLAVVGIAFTVWLILSTYLTLMDTPTVTSERPNRESVLDLPFPAVAFCSENRISREALLQYADFVLNATANATTVHIGRDIAEVAHNLLVLGKMYEFRMDDDDFYRFDRVHSVLSAVYNGAYPISEILAKLVPRCDTLLKRCKWLGRPVDCADLFEVRRSYIGNCCAFNYVRPAGTVMLRQAQFNRTVTPAGRTLRVRKHGPGFGLAVMLDQRLQDYAFALHSSRGVRVMVFDPVNFPDQASGAVMEKFLGVGEEMFLSVAPQPKDGADDMRKYDRVSRNCVFADEIELVYDKFYTLSECLLVCRMDNILRFCGCLPPQYVLFYADSRRCLLDDMPCLSRWGAKWFSSDSLVSGGGNAAPTDAVELENDCPACLPMCSMVKYYLESSTSNFVGDAFDGRQLDPEFTQGLQADNHSIVYINFGRHKVAVYEQDNLSTWYEQLALFGGLASLTFGASLISVVELIYFGTGRFGAQFFAWRAARRNVPPVGGILFAPPAEPRPTPLR